MSVTDDVLSITGRRALNARGDWPGFEAAQIFPLAYETHWLHHGYSSCITVPPARRGSINSVQNGLLLRSDIHQLFDSYLVSNPDVCSRSAFMKPQLIVFRISIKSSVSARMMMALRESILISSY